MKGSGPKLDNVRKGISYAPKKLKNLESRISANPVKGIDSAAEKVMGSNVIQTADRMTEATGTKIKEAAGTLVNNKATRFIAKPVKAIAASISKKLEDTCDVVTTIQASDCEGNVINTVNLYGCLNNNDLAPIIDVILNKMQIVLWPCISQKNNVIMRFLVNHLLHWILVWFYVGCIIDIFKFTIEEKACGHLDEMYDKGGLGALQAVTTKSVLGICGQDDIFSHPFSDGWWDPNHGENILGRDTSRCDDRFYKKKCPYNGTVKSYVTDMTLWKDENKAKGGKTGHRGDSSMDGELCNNSLKCPNSFGHGLGIDEGNAPRKYKECCEFNIRYITGDEHEGHHFPTIPSGVRAVCDIEGILSGELEFMGCVAEEGWELVNSLNPWSDYHAPPGCDSPLKAAYAKGNTVWKNCVNEHIENAGCGDYYKAELDNTPEKNPLSRNEMKPMPGRVHADNAIWQYHLDHPSEKTPDIDWNVPKPYPTAYTPAYNKDGKEIGQCDPTKPKYANASYCLGPFQKPTVTQKFFGAQECMKDIPIWDIIKYLYRIMFFIFIFLWLFKITDGSSFGRGVIFILLGLYVWWRVYDYNKKK